MLMSDQKKTIKFQMMMSPAEAEALDDWGFSNRIRSRAEAIRRLMQIAFVTESRIAALKASTLDVARDQKLLRKSLMSSGGELTDEMVDRVEDALDRVTMSSLAALNMASEIQEVTLIAQNKKIDDETLAEIQLLRKEYPAAHEKFVASIKHLMTRHENETQREAPPAAEADEGE